MATKSSVEGVPERNAADSQVLTREERNQRIALHHATLLQQRKEVEAQILGALEELIEFPSMRTVLASAPSKEDLDRFQELIPPFNTSDFDDLIVERNCAMRCGYVFCRQPVKKDSPPGDYKRLQFGGGSLKVVAKGKLEMWCSALCAKRAMFLKVQLSEVSAWERAGGIGGKLELLSESDSSVLEHKMKTLNIADDEQKTLHKAMQDLALERGETLTSGRLGLVMTEGLLERNTLGPAVAPTVCTSTPGAIEGYVPKHGIGSDAGDSDGSDDRNDGDWKVE